jgi:hypothetical protein
MCPPDLSEFSGIKETNKESVQEVKSKVEN